MGYVIKKRVERRCSTCKFGQHDEDQVPCLPCFESEIRFSQWKIDPDYLIDQVNKMTQQDKETSVWLA